uniref:Major sperm protein n=1 Tax=Panagrolaimus davidi TaxID=227884 RepID=A0A914QUU6_9BILA
MVLGIGFGIFFQRLFHIIEDSPPILVKSKKSLRKLASSAKIQPFSKSYKQGLTKSEKVSSNGSADESSLPSSSTISNTFASEESSAPTEVSSLPAAASVVTFATEQITAPTQNVTVQNSVIQQCSPPPLTNSVIGSVGPLTSKNSSLANYLQWTKKKQEGQQPSTSLCSSPKSAATSSAPSTTTLAAEKSPTPTEFSVHESDQPKPYIPLPSGDAQSYTATFPSSTSYFVEMPIMNDTPVSSFNEAPITSATSDESTLRESPLLNRPIPSRQHLRHQHTSISTTDWSRTPIRSGLQSIISQRRTPNEVSSIKSVETLPCFENDLSSDPRHTINFKSPFNQNVNLTVTNVTTNKIMWALKTNAMDRIIATPTCGFLKAGNTVHIKMAIREKSQIHPADSSRDRLAIDYVFVPEACVAFDPARLLAKNAYARRKSFDINYVF